MPTITSRSWGKTPEGPVHLYTLTNKHGNTVSISNYGATITSIKIDDAEMVLGYDELVGYLSEQPYFGATIGRFGNRIANGKFSIGEKTFRLPINNGPNCLHGGTEGFDKRIWQMATAVVDGEERLVFQLVSPDGDQGFPGELKVMVMFRWTDDNDLIIKYTAFTDHPTVINLTNHTYFNIGSKPNVLDQSLELKSDRFVPINEHSIPLGQLAEVVETPFDFRSAKPIGQDIATDHPQLKIAGGYDHTWVLPTYGQDTPALTPFATITDPATGRKLHCATTEPGVQVFTANFAAGQFSGRHHTPLPPHSAICLETQHFPDSPNQEAFPSTLLKPGETFTTVTSYRFE